MGRVPGGGGGRGPGTPLGSIVLGARVPSGRKGPVCTQPTGQKGRAFIYETGKRQLPLGPVCSNMDTNTITNTQTFILTLKPTLTLTLILAPAPTVTLM